MTHIHRWAISHIPLLFVVSQRSLQEGTGRGMSYRTLGGLGEDATSLPRGALELLSPIQGCLASQKTRPPRTTQMPMVVVGGGGVVGRAKLPLEVPCTRKLGTRISPPPSPPIIFGNSVEARSKIVTLLLQATLSHTSCLN